MKNKLLTIVAVGLLAAPMGASAGIVFQSVADLSDVSQITYGYCSTCQGASVRMFDKFTLSGPETITGFSVSLYSNTPLYSYYAQYWPNSIDFSVWTVNGSNLPGVQLFSQTIAAANFTETWIPGAYALNVIAETEDLTGLTLDSGIYYVSFYNPSNLAVNGYLNEGGNFYQQGSNVFLTGQSAGFTLTNSTVPEPGTLALLGLGLPGLGFARRRKNE